MQHASQRSPGWADLQPELLLQVAALLGNEDRWGECGSLQGAKSGVGSPRRSPLRHRALPSAKT